MVLDQTEVKILKCGLVSDTHGVADQEVLDAFVAHEVDLIYHAGDVGSHGGHAELLNFFRALVPSIAVRGNVDDTATKEELPEHVLQSHLGWDIFVTHVADPGRGYEGLVKVLEKRPDIVLHGHSHKYGVTEQDGILFINPGSAGPARFKLPRTAAILKLQQKASGAKPEVLKIDLASKAPKRISAAWAGSKTRKGKAKDNSSLPGLFDTGSPGVLR